MQLRGLEELCVLRRSEQLFGIHVAAQRRAGLDIDDAGVDRVATEAARHRNAMVAVDNVIAVADLVDVDRRQLPAFDHRGVDPRPSIAQPSRCREETRKEITGLRRRRG
jgi:hypothetical protein